jgi:Fur family transcriptional regulator, peroxide stress response regulator
MKKPQRTEQRMAILNYLKDNRSHPSIKDIYAFVSKKLPSVSLATVYNTMEMLKKNGLVSEIPVLNGEARKFDSNPMPHDHLICSSCGAVFDIDLNLNHSHLLMEKQQKGFYIKDLCVTTYGSCSKCHNQGQQDLHEGIKPS